MSAATPQLRATITALYAGGVQVMPGDGRPTGIFKQPRAGVVAIAAEGVVGDVQADRRVHGGPEKALHHFPAEHYAQFAGVFTPSAGVFAPGNIGENLSSLGLREEDVCIGDVYALGSARLQISQPRTPCWKIDARFAVEGLTEMIEARGMAGWYYRVLQPGLTQAGDELRLLERNAEPVSLREYWNLKHALRPSLDALQRLIATPGLAPMQAERWRQRLDWLRKQGNAGDAG